jgi:class 3 adenylate cyclase
MVDAITQRDKRLAEAEQEKGELLRSIYPAGLAERVRSGAEFAAETVSNVTVAIALIDGLEVVAARRSATEVRAILNALLDALNTAATNHGVEPVRSLGESYVGICGLSSPRPDHANRALAWARAATLALQRLGEDWAKSVSLRFGLASGDIDVLLTGRRHAAYDVWGRTLGIARRIVQEAAPGCVRISQSTYALLTDVEGFEACPPIETPAFGIIKTWGRPVVDHAPDESAGPGKDEPASNAMV